MQTLDIFQSLWAMELRRPDGFEHTNEERFKMIRQAGYKGVCLDPTSAEIDDMLKLKPLYEEHGLECLVNAFPNSVEDLRPLLEFAKEMQAPHVNIIGQVFPLTPEEAVPTIEGWMNISNEIGVTILLETHRDCITNDMFFTLNLMDLVPDMRLCADLSHYIVGREMRTPLGEFDQGLFNKLLSRSDSFQGRIANREQVQVPITFPQHAEWVELAKSWWKRGLKDWKARSGPDDRLIFLCELGPPPYGITGADGYELSDRWKDALIIKGWVEDIWSNL